ncbi:MAG: glycosyltransferase family 4 protein [Cyclobacteriaceae bacterium]|nr:glycosyltransferase family 4 protein [Cyclobacteriaceae bacterium]
MKIAIVLNTSWNIYNFRMGLVKALLTQGHEVIAIAPRDEYTHHLVEAGCSYHEITMDSRGANAIKDLGLIFELFGIYRKVKPDVILQYTIKPNIYGTLAASVLRIPTVNNVCGLGTAFLNKGLVSKIAIGMYKLAFKFPKLIYFQNEDDKAFFKEHNIIKNNATKVLPGSGINLSHFKPAPEVVNKKFTFLLISRLIHDKGIIEYIDAVKYLKEKGIEANFQILGNKDIEHRRGISEDIINSWIESNVVEYLGSTDDVRPFINSADCVVLPSYREGTPKSLLEAASSAKPIVATDVAGCTNIVKDNINGMLCKVKDVKDLADKLEAMTKLPQSRLSEMGKESRKIVENKFDEKIVIDSYLNTISSFQNS